MLLTAGIRTHEREITNRIANRVEMEWAGGRYVGCVQRV